MKTFFTTAFSMIILGMCNYLFAQTADGGIFGSGTTLTVKFKPSADITGTFSGGNIGIRWLSSLGAGVNLSGESGSFGYVNQGAKTVSGSYEYIVYTSTSSIGTISTTYTNGVEYTLMTVTVSGGVGTGDFELTPSGFAGDAGLWYIELAGFDRANLTPANWYYQAVASGVSLPVELTSFSAVAKGRNAELTWKTATETNNAGFEIQRKQEGTEWFKIRFVEGSGTTNAPKEYSFSDNNLTAGAYSYRLKQIDRDGQFSYSSQVEVATALSAEDYTLSTNYPNPFNPSTKFTFAVKNSEAVAVKVFNALGQEVASLFNGVADANKLYEMNFNASSLASGTYFYMLRTKDRYEIKKMLLVK